MDSEVLNWTPEQPFGETEPRFAPGNDIGWTDDWRAEPKAAAPEPPAVLQSAALPAPEPLPEESEPARADAAPEAVPAVVETPATAEPAPAPEATPPVADAPHTPPVPANLNRAPNLLPIRLGIGLTQGLLLYLLTQARAADVWPGSDPYLYSAFSLALVFAPLVLLEGLGDIETRLLALWSGTVATLLATLGLYRHWRMEGVEQLHADYPLLALVTVALVIAQSLLRAGLRDGRIVASYRTLFETAWSLAARLCLWLLLAGIAWALIGSGNSLFNWLRAHHPAFPLTMAPTLVILPLLGLCSAAAFDLTALGWMRRAGRAALLTCCTVALPLLAAVSIGLIAARAQSAPLMLGLAALLLLALNASYRDGAARARWRKGCEFAAAFLILALAILAAFALAARVSALGWTANRILVCAATAALILYGAFTTAAALMSLGGGRWMQPIEPVNRVLALLLLAGCCALVSPLADPLPLAVQAQTARLTRTDPAAFDFAWLARD
ncbi:MAG TPA: hypothetical protein VGC16_10760, partial [Rhizomicrobium sp.]